MPDSLSISKELIDCVLCGGRNFSPLYPDELENKAPPVDYNFTAETRKTYAIVKCSDCGMVFTNPMPNLRNVYSENSDPQYMASLPQRQLTAELAVRRLLKQVPAKGRLLDIGCACGIFLDAAAPYFQVEGIELSQWAAQIARQKHKVHELPLPQLGLKEEFDVITLFGVIEHFDDPNYELAAIAQALKPGGSLLVYTGDLDALLPKILGKKWWWFQGMHLLYFSRKSLEAMLAKHGLKTYAHENYTVYFQLFSLAVSFRRYKFLAWLTDPLFNLPFLKKRMLPLRLSGEMLVYAKKATS